MKYVDKGFAGGGRKSPPARGRGLKLLRYSLPHKGWRVAPCAGAWIEMLNCRLVLRYS